MSSAEGPGLALLSAALWGTGDFGGGLAARRLPSAAVVAWQQLAGLTAVAVVVLVTGAWAVGPGWVPWAVLAGAAGSAGSAYLVAFYAALATGTMGVVSPVAATGAVVPVAVGLLTGDRPSSTQLLGMAAALVGAVLAAGPDARAARSAASRSVVLAAASGVCFGTAFLGIAGGSATSTLMTLLGMRATSVTGFVVLAVALRTVGGVRRRDVPLLAGIGLLDAGANLLYGLSTTLGLLSLVTVLASLYPVVTVVLARVVLRERLGAVQTVGVVAALGGVVLVAAG